MTAPARLLASVLALGVASVAAPACQSVFGKSAPDAPSPDGWVDSEPFKCLDEELLWELAKGAVARNGYRIDDDLTTWKGRRIVTAWYLDLSHRFDRGTRRRRFLEIVADKKKPGWYTARAAIVVQTNAEIADPLNPAEAKWRDAEPDTEEAERIAFTLASRFREGGPSEEFESR
jgi:hypothetical protein